MDHDLRFAVLDAFQNSREHTYFTHHQLEGQNQFLTEKIPDILRAANPILALNTNLERTEFKYSQKVYVGGADPDRLRENITFTKPALFRGNGADEDGYTMRVLFPNEARKRKIDYVTIMQCPVDVEITIAGAGPKGDDGKPTDTVEMIRMPSPLRIRIPAMIKSRACSLYGLPNVVAQREGEGKHDQGGQFILHGSEKVVVAQERIAPNQPFTRLQRPTEEQVASVTIASRALSGVRTRKFSLQLFNTDASVLPNKRAHYRGVILATIIGINGAVPLYTLFRALGLTTDKEITEHIQPNLEFDESIDEILRLNMNAAGTVKTTADALEYLRTFVVNTSHTTLQNALRNNFLLNAPDDLRSKRLQLGYLTRLLLDTQSGTVPPVDRDNQRYKHVVGTGTLLTELFSDIYETFQNEFIRNLTSKYNYNQAVQQDTKHRMLFLDSDGSDLFPVATIETGISKALRGSWPDVDGASQELSHLTQFDRISHLRRIVATLPDSVKASSARNVNLSAYGQICPVESPSGGPKIGLVKNLAVLCDITKSTPPEDVMDIVRENETFVPMNETTPQMLIRGTRGVISINGSHYGSVENGLELAAQLRMLRARGKLPNTTGISVDWTRRMIEVRTDADRMVRPLFNTGIMKVMRTFRKLLEGVSRGDIGYHELLHAGRDSTGAMNSHQESLFPTGTEVLSVLDLIDAHEANNILLVDTPADIERVPGASHCEIHTSTIFGVMGSLIPWSPHNQGPRNIQSIAQSKQATSLYSTAFLRRHDTSQVLAAPQRPLGSTQYGRRYGGGVHGYGVNLVVALACFTGQNQEDGVLMNRDSIERGLFHILQSKVWAAEETENEMTGEATTIEDPRKYGTAVRTREGTLNFEHIDPETGVARVGAEVHGKDVLIGMTSKVPGHQPADVSVATGKWDGGQVQDVVILKSPAGKKKVSVKLGQVRTPEFGDKMSSRAGQKGTIGMLVQGKDMPMTANGIVPDLIVNPHAIPKRMTVGQFVEVVAAKAAALAGIEVDATAFTNAAPMESLGDYLKAAGYDRECDEVMQNGVTGEQIPTEVFISPTYYMRLKHMVKDKQNARGKGPMVRLTRQPVHGRGDEGGLRIGEMERDVLIGHGISEFLTESMMVRSDGAEFDVCRKSGQLAAVNERAGIQLSPAIDGPLQYRGETVDALRLDGNVERSQSFTKVQMPYSMKLAIEEMEAGLNASVRLVMEGDIGRPVPRHGDALANIPELPEEVVVEDEGNPADEAEEKGEQSGGVREMAVEAGVATRRHDELPLNMLPHQELGISTLTAMRLQAERDAALLQKLPESKPSQPVSGGSVGGFADTMSGSVDLQVKKEGVSGEGSGDAVATTNGDTKVVKIGGGALN